MAHGEFSINSAAASVIATGDTYQKASGTTTAGMLNAMTSPSDMRLTYTGASTQVFDVHCSISLTADTNNKLSSLVIAKNGTPDLTTAITRKIGTGSDQGAVGIGGLIELATNDYVELWVTAEDSAIEITIEQVSMTTASL